MLERESSAGPRNALRTRFVISFRFIKMAELQGTPVAQDALSVAQLELGGNPNALALRRPFDPVAHDLDATFHLTRFADLKG